MFLLVMSDQKISEVVSSAGVVCRRAQMAWRSCR